MTRHKPRLIALHCSAKGIGFAVFEGEAIYDWGTVVTRGDKNAMALRKLTHLLDRFSPETLVVEDPEKAVSRADRIFQLHSAIRALCVARAIDFVEYPLPEIRVRLGLALGATRQDVAEAVVRHLDVLAPRLPSPRKPWQSEPRRMAIFCAAAVALAHLSHEREFDG